MVETVLRRLIVIFLCITRGFLVVRGECSEWDDVGTSNNDHHQAEEGDFVIRRIPAAVEEHGYSQLSAASVITTKEAFQTWLPPLTEDGEIIDGQQLKTWFGRTEFLNSFRKAAIDFDENNLIIYAYERSTGCGNRFIPDPIVDETHRTASIALDIHEEEGAQIMVSCALFYQVKKSIRAVYFDVADVYGDEYTSNRVRHVVSTNTADSPNLSFVSGPSPHDAWVKFYANSYDTLHYIYRYGFSDHYQHLTTVVLDSLESFDEWLQRVLRSNQQSAEGFFRILRALHTEKASLDFKHYNLVVYVFDLRVREGVIVFDDGIIEKNRTDHSISIPISQSITSDSQNSNTNMTHHRRHYVSCFQAHKSIHTIHMEVETSHYDGDGYTTTSIRNEPASDVRDDAAVNSEL